MHQVYWGRLYSLLWGLIWANTQKRTRLAADLEISLTQLCFCGFAAILQCNSSQVSKSAQIDSTHCYKKGFIISVCLLCSHGDKTLDHHFLFAFLQGQLYHSGPGSLRNRRNFLISRVYSSSLITLKCIKFFKICFLS